MNGDSPVTWHDFQKHLESSSQMADEGFQRLTTVEVEVKQIKITVQDNGEQIRALQKTVWMASGMIVAIVTLVQLVVNALK